ncbi:MAG: hypothetical protein ACI836_001523 [Saprospiraceae bacterium]|jgi:hypothetical protein
MGVQKYKYLSIIQTHVSLFFTLFKYSLFLYENRPCNVSFIHTIQHFLKHIFYIFLYLNIHTALYYDINAQYISLTLEAEKEIPSELIEKTATANSFSTFAALKTETSSLLKAFQTDGFIDSRLISITEIKTQENTKKLIYKATYFLGPKFSNITIHYNQEDFSSKELNRFISKIEEDRFIISISEVEKTLMKINALQTESGDAFAKTYLNEFKRDGVKLSAQLISETTQTRTIDSIVIKGYEKFPTSYIRYIAGIKKDVIFKISTIAKASTAISALQFASNIKQPEVLFKDKKTTLYLYLEKQKSNNFDGIIGFSTDDVTNKLIFNGYLDLKLNNNLNYGETFSLNYKSDGDNQQNFSVQTTLPYILRSPLGIDLGLTIFKQADNFSTTSQLAGLRYQINPNTIVTLNYTSSNSAILSNEDVTAIDLVAFQKKEIITGSQWKFYQEDNLFPVKARFGLQIGAGTKKTDLTTEQQYRLSAHGSYIINLNLQNSFYIANQSGFLQSDTYLTNELYRIGGIKSIRGFKENAIEASLFSILNTEYRYRLNNLLYVHSIVDLGYLENRAARSNNSLFSFGFGTGFYTNTGLLRLSLANGKVYGQEFRFSDTKVHLSLISTF